MLDWLFTKQPAPAAAGPQPDAVRDLLKAIPTLQEYAISQAQTASRQEFAKVFLEQATTLCRADFGGVFLWDEASKNLVLGASSEGFHGDPATAERCYTLSQTLATRSAGASMLTVPIMALSKPLGVAQFQGAKTSGEVHNLLFNVLSGEAAIILHQIDLFEKLQIFHIEMVETLYRAAHPGDQDAKNTSARTRERARKLALAMNLSRTMLPHVEYAALLRNVGKMGINQAILNKPDKLTPAEYEEIKKYTTIGHQLLGQVKLLAPAARMVLYHQEWFNGRGYPEGLKGEDIPIGARIIAVLSAWEAMTTDRPYRKALAHEQAAQELRRAAGNQFDPKVVEAFLKIESPKT